MKAQDSFSLILLNHLITAPVFFHWLTFRMDRSSVLMPSRIDLLIFPSSLFVGFINRQVDKLKIKFFFKDFYPTIMEKILDNAISFAKELTHVSDEKIRIVKHCRKSLLYNNETPWVKKNTPGNFDVTMGSYDGAEVYELVGVYILSF